jgi:hypothetical protein
VAALPLYGAVAHPDASIGSSQLTGCWLGPCCHLAPPGGQHKHSIRSRGYCCQLWSRVAQAAGGGAGGTDAWIPTSHSAVVALHIAAAAKAAAEAAASSGEAAAPPPLAAQQPARAAAGLNAAWELGAADPAAQSPGAQNALRDLLNTSFANLEPRHVQPCCTPAKPGLLEAVSDAMVHSSRARRGRRLMATASATAGFYSTQAGRSALYSSW